MIALGEDVPDFEAPQPQSPPRNALSQYCPMYLARGHEGAVFVPPSPSDAGSKQPVLPPPQLTLARVMAKAQRASPLQLGYTVSTMPGGVPACGGWSCGERCIVKNVPLAPAHDMSGTVWLQSEADRKDHAKPPLRRGVVKSCRTHEASRMCNMRTLQKIIQTEGAEPDLLQDVWERLGSNGSAPVPPAMRRSLEDRLVTLQSSSANGGPKRMDPASLNERKRCFEDAIREGCLTGVEPDDDDLKFPGAPDDTPTHALGGDGASPPRRTISSLEVDGEASDDEDGHARPLDHLTDSDDDDPPPDDGRQYERLPSGKWELSPDDEVFNPHLYKKGPPTD